MNLDGAICEVDGRAASGVVVRDHTTFLGASTKVYDGVMEPLIAEALAARDACAYAVQRGFGKVVLATDCQVLMKHWADRKNDRSVIRTILDEISDLKSSFSSFHFLYEGREANQGAHCCAKFAAVNDEPATWDAEPHPWLVHNLMADCNGV
jgi:ribonuclease HI